MLESEPFFLKTLRKFRIMRRNSDYDSLKKLESECFVRKNVTQADEAEFSAARARDDTRSSEQNLSDLLDRISRRINP